MINIIESLCGFFNHLLFSQTISWFIHVTSLNVMGDTRTVQELALRFHVPSAMQMTTVKYVLLIQIDRFPNSYVSLVITDF